MRDRDGGVAGVIARQKEGVLPHSLFFCFFLFCASSIFRFSRCLVALGK
jgi:hypothetical protein